MPKHAKSGKHMMPGKHMMSDKQMATMMKDGKSKAAKGRKRRKR